MVDEFFAPDLRTIFLIQQERVVNFQEKTERLCTQVFLPAITTFRLIAIDYESWPKTKVSGSANYRGAKSPPASWRKEGEQREVRKRRMT